MAEDPAERERTIALLEGRRLAIADSMWHAPALVVAGQAFLLQVLTQPGLDRLVGALTMSAGILASVAVGLSLWQQWDRERLHSEAVKEYAGTDLNRHKLAKRVGREERSLGNPLEWKVWLAWEVVMLVFIAADIAAFAVSH